MSMIDKLAYIYFKNDQILVTRSNGKQVWYIPGGKREPGESDHQALTPEVYEELTVQLIPTSIEYLSTYQAQAHGKPAGTMVSMTCYTAQFTGSLTPANEIAQIDFFSYQDKHKTALVDQLIFDDLHHTGLLR